MIVTVTPNPALDVTYELPTPLAIGSEHRVSAVASRAGGKGVNVARALHSLSAPVAATGLCGGPGGAELRADLDATGIRHDFVDALPDVRRTVVVQDSDGVTTALWEPGYPPADPRWAAKSLAEHVGRLVEGAQVLTVSGSLPPGVDRELPARLARDAMVAGVPCIVDVSGDALQAAITAGVAAVMPNADELAAVVGERPAGAQAAAEMAQDLAGRYGGPAVIVTLGPDGIVAATRSNAWWAHLDDDVAGNPTGAGDAACASIARHLIGGLEQVDWPTAIADAVALSAAAVVRPVAGEIDLGAYHRWRPTTITEPI